MATLYSNTGTPDGFVASNTFYVTTAPPEGTISAIITSITLSFHQSNSLPYGPGTVRCKVKLVGGSYADYVVSDPFTFDTTNKVISFTFPSVNAELNFGNIIEIVAGTPGGVWPYPYWTIYKDTVSAKVYITIEGSWAGAGETVYAEGTKTVTISAIVDYITGPGKAWNPTPTDDQEDIKIRGKNQLKKLQWEAPT